MVDFAQLATFQAVIGTGSFEAAARELHVTPSAVSQRIKALERSVGQVLVRRAKPCVATPAGEALVRFAGQVALLEREALAEARDGTRVSIVVNADSLHTWFLPALKAVPGPTYELHTDDEFHTADLLRSGTAMAAVTADKEVVQGCRIERLGVMRYLACGQAGASTAVLYNRKDRLQHAFVGDLSEMHYIPSASAYIEAIRIGLGWGMVQEWIAREDIAAGHYVDLHPGRYLDVPLYWQYWKIGSEVLDELTAAVKTAAAPYLRS
ncbi:LysR family transcriptional regulator ArgP [Actinoplanes sp. LDG1-06]|uniref:LysR family transcriptional regulator ArgP n=1 Tax=Paractinoplanes ovalisporus TaxID=2810368 RepID=A0ABS2ARK3_9ACTN|nr:LysR family transcriptional regulator ArgP [Actinoplanes ovalisporus]MBM2622483.1 LysR family transcriptional regulator ArgP [Actinoplanes ovalisporus]